MTQVVIYTDGACSGNPGPGGWGAWLSYGDHEREICGGEVDTTNNRMEMMAVIQALRLLNRPCDVKIITDSKYVMDGSRSWMPAWKARGWSRGNKEIKNLDLWKLLDAELSQHQVHWKWVRGHSGNPGNERADQLANDGMDQIFDEHPELELT